jgi:hypothetical protein
VDQLLDDLEEVIKSVKQNPPKDGDMVALYGESSALVEVMPRRCC